MSNQSLKVSWFGKDQPKRISQSNAFTHSFRYGASPLVLGSLPQYRESDPKGFKLSCYKEAKASYDELNVKANANTVLHGLRRNILDKKEVCVELDNTKPNVIESFLLKKADKTLHHYCKVLTKAYKAAHGKSPYNDADAASFLITDGASRYKTNSTSYIHIEAEGGEIIDLGQLGKESEELQSLVMGGINLISKFFGPMITPYDLEFNEFGREGMMYEMFEMDLEDLKKKRPDISISIENTDLILKTLTDEQIGTSELFEMCGEDPEYYEEEVREKLERYINKQEGVESYLNNSRYSEQLDTPTIISTLELDINEYVKKNKTCEWITFIRKTIKEASRILTTIEAEAEYHDLFSYSDIHCDFDFRPPTQGFWITTRTNAQNRTVDDMMNEHWEMGETYSLILPLDREGRSSFKMEEVMDRLGTGLALLHKAEQINR